MPHIRFLFVRLAVCYRLPSSIRCLLDSAELLVLPATGRTVDFHHTITRALPGALKKEAAEQTFSAASFEFERLVCSHPRITTPASGIKDAYMAASASANFVPGRNGTDMAKGFICSRPGITTS